jgi:hypothetical protein
MYKTGKIATLAHLDMTVYIPGLLHGLQYNMVGLNIEKHYFYYLPLNIEIYVCSIFIYVLIRVSTRV